LRSANARLAHRPSKSVMARHFSAIPWIMIWLCGGTSGQVARPARASENQTNLVHGTVVNAVTLEPIGRALVHSPDNRYASLSDSEGHFEFTLPESSTIGNLLTLTAQRPGFLDDPNGQGQVVMSAGAALTIPLIPEALIKGRVTLGASEPASGVNVELLMRSVQDGLPRWTTRTGGATNSNGEFRFAELQPGTYKVLTHEWMDNDPGTLPGAQTYGFPPVYYPNSSDVSAAAPIQIAAGQTAQADMSLVRAPYYPVKIPVTNAGENVGINVNVSRQGQHGPGYSLEYNQANRVIEGLLPAGRYLVEAASFGVTFTSGSVNLTIGGGPAEGPAMILAPDNSIPVNVKEEFTNDTSPRSGMWNNGRQTFSYRGPRLDVYMNAEPVDDFVPRGAGSIRQPTGPEDESLVLQNLAPGRYWLRIGGARGYVASATMGGTDLLREPLIVVPGSSTSIDITLRDDSAKLEGTLANFAPTQASPGLSSPAGFVECIPLPDSHGQFLEIPISPDGKFEVMNVPPGAYRVIAFSKPEREIPYRDPEAMKAYESKGQVVNLAPGQKVTVQLQLVSSR
jgi:hypothetical protein